MNLAGLLARGRAAHALILTDTATITRVVPGTLNETTGVYAATTTTVYTGAARIKPAATSAVDAAGMSVDATRPTLDLPWVAVGVVLPGDLVTITAGPLAGTVAEVFAEIAGSTSTCRRYTLEVGT